MKRLLFFLMAIMFAISGWTQTTVTIGSGTSTSTSGPIPGYYGFHNSAMIFKASEMTQAGTIQSFGLEISTSNSTSTRSMKIYLKEVSDTSLSSSQIMNNLLDGAVLVYDSTNVDCSSTGWRDFVFSTPFNYSGTNSLLVIVTGSGCTTGGGCSVAVKYSSTPSNKAWTKVIDNSNIDFSTLTTNSNTYRFNSRFSISSLPTDFCYPPSNLVFNNISHFSANLSWASNTSVSSWIIEYKPASSTTWISDVSSTNSFSFVGLDAGTSYNVRVKSNCTSSSNESGWIATTFSTLLSCPAPSAIVIPSASAGLNEALVTWNPISNPATWNEGYLIQYKPQTIEDWNLATSISAIQDTFYLIQGLTPSTLYNVRIKSVCNPGLDSSTWVTSSFRTSCEAVISNLPWIESFEGDWNSSFVAPGNKTAPYCWINIDSLNTGTYYWQTSSTAKYGSKAAYMYGYTSSTTTTATYKNNDWLVSPIITFTGTERLNFWSKKSSSSYYPDLLIYAMDVSQGDLNATNANFILMGQLDSTVLSTTYSEFQFNLTSLVGDYRLAFVRKKIANGSVYIDGVKVSTIPNCLPPTALTISNISTDQADISWTPNDIADESWNIHIKNTATNTTDIIPVTETTHTFTNLIPNTNYYIVITTDCSNGVQSDTSSSVMLRTNCIPAAVPYFENFSTSVVVEPTCWTRKEGFLADTSILITSTSGWAHSTTLDTAMRFNIDAATDRNWLISPSIDLGDGSVQYQVEFDAVLTAYASAPSNPPTYDSDDKFAVVISTDNGLTWLKTNATIWAEGDVDTERNFSNFGLTPTHVVVKLIDSLQVPYSGIVKIGFYGESTVSVTDNYLYIDNVAINEIPQCPDVFNVTAIASTFTSAKVSFATDNAEVGVGWDLAYGTAVDATSFDPDNATIIPINDPTNVPYTINNLNSGTTYYFAVRQNCGGVWSQIANVNLPLVQTTSTLPYTQNFNDFSTTTEWTLSNPDTNKWYIGSAVNYPEVTGNSLYISNTLGATNDYAKGVIAYAYASTLIDFGTGAAEYNLSFDWRANGESASYDYLKVFILPLDQSIPTTGWPNGQDISGVLNLKTTWQHANIILPASEYDNTIKKLVFVWWNDISGGTDPSAAVDNISLLAMSCASPSNLVVSSTDQTSATLSWTENGTSTSWLVEYSIDGINWLSEVATTNTNFILTGLNPSLTYQVKVSSQCSPTDISSSVLSTFRTGCGLVTQFPWIEGFENTWVDAVSPGNRISPSCWININKGAGSTNYWSLTTSYYHTGIGSAQMYTDNSSQNNDWLITPQMTLTGNERVNFWAMNYSATSTEVDEISVWISDANLSIDTTNMGVLGTLTGFTQIYQTGIPVGPWLQYEVDLSQYSGNRYIAFVRRNTPDNGYYLRLDDVKVSELPNCRRVSNIALTSISHQDATITWTPGQTTDAAWNIYLTQGTTTVVIPATQIPTTIPNLLPNTSYSVIIKTDCGTEESDPTTLPLIFKTTCLPQAVPYLEQFTTTPLTNNCWEQHNGLLTDTVTFTSNSSSWTHNSTNPTAAPITSMRLNIYGTTMKSWLITPTIDLGSTTNLYQLEFDVTNTDDAQMLIPGVLTGVDDKFAVVISTDNGLSWYKANAHIWSNETGASRLYNDLMSTTPIHIIIPLQDENLIPYQGLIKVGFYGESTISNADNYLNIDNIAVNEWVDCQRPTSLAVSGVTENQAIISFTEQGVATSWEYSLGIITPGIENDPDLGTLTSISDNPHTILSLTPSTNYFVAVRSDCLSPWSDIVTFRTNSLPVDIFPYFSAFDTTDLESFNWTSVTNSANKWVIGAATNSTLSPSTEATAAYMSFNDGDSNSVTTATTRAYFYRDFDFGSTPTTYDLSFDWKCLGTYNSSTNTVSSGIMVIPCEITDSINLGGLPLNQNQRVLLLHSQTDWQNATAQLDNMSGVKRLIFFTWGGYVTANRYNPAAIDNINIVPATCARPTDVTASNINSNSAQITWNGSADSYILTYRASTDTVNTYVPVIGNAASLTNLTSGTTYYVWIKSICGTDTTINSSSISFLTPCYDNAISTFPYNEGFENGLSCWTVLASGTAANSFWQIQTSGTNPTCTPHGGLNMVRFNSFSSPNTAGTWTAMISPALNFTSDMQASFWIYRDANSSYLSPLERVSLYVSSSQSLLDTILLGEIPRSITVAPIVATEGWYEYTFPIPTGTIGTQYIVLKATSNYGNNIFIDDVKVDILGGTIPCLDPTGITVSSVTNTTANVTWTPTGTEAAWQVRLGETGTPIDVTSTSYPLTNLTPSTNYIVYVRANCGTGYSAWVASTQFTTLVTPPTVVTNAATLIAQTIATLNGAVAAGTESITAQGFEWRATGAATWTTVNATGTTITHNLTGLIANTAYEFKAFATTVSGTIYGTTLTFTTLQEGVTPPTVETSAATSIAQTTATINGSITLGTEPITAQGFEWKATGAATWTTVNATGTTITHNLTGLIANTAYEFRAFATTASGTEYGTTLSFTTLPNVAPNVVTNAATLIAQTIATLNGAVTAGTETITAQGFEWRATGVATWTTVNATGTTITHNLTGLIANTAYEFRAFATTASGTINGTTLNFTTLPNVAQIVVTTPATNLGGREATLNGTVTAGTETITAQGFEWKAASATTWTNVTATLTGNAITHNLIGLTPNTAYEFRAYATTASGTINGTTLNFTTLGLHDAEGNSISVMMYPNPATSETKLIVSGVDGATTIVLSDVQGRILSTIDTKAINGTVEQTINVNNLAKGVYYVRIQNSNLSRTQKLIVK